MADAERELLAKVIRDQAMKGLLEAKVDDRFFVDEEHLAVLAWMLEHYREYGTSPSEQALRDNNPTYKLPPTPEPLDYYVKQLRKRYHYDIVGRAVSEAAEYVEDGDSVEAARLLEVALNNVNVVVSPLRDHNLTDPEVFERRFAFYESLTEDPDELRGYATGFDTLDLATMGLQAGQLITLFGPPKAGKSTVALCVADHIAKEGADVLMVSFEMSYEEMDARWIGLRAGLNYRRLLKGRMNDLDRKRMKKELRKLKEAGEEAGRLILSEDISSTTTVSGIIAKVQQHKPDVLVIDGVYLMDDENGEPKGSSQAITNITRSLKRLGQLFSIPVLITTQALYSKMKGQSVGAASIGYSSSFGQDSDTVIGVEPRENEHGEKEHWLKVLLSRSGPLTEVHIDFDWATSTFTEFASAYDPNDDPDLEDDGLYREEREHQRGKRGGDQKKRGKDESAPELQGRRRRRVAASSAG